MAGMDSPGGAGGQPFALSGTFTYDAVPTRDYVRDGKSRLAYEGTVARPARRVIIEALRGSVVVTSTLTDDAGAFTLNVPAGGSVKLRARARSVGHLTSGVLTASHGCPRGTWDFQIVDNTRADALYAFEDAERYGADRAEIVLRAAVEHQDGLYQQRDGAPFAILDTLVTSLDVVCRVEPTVTLPRLAVHWSAKNVSAFGDFSLGQVGGSYYRPNATDGHIYLLGKEDVDTEEFDRHVIAHEFCHFLHDKLYRLDATGGPHWSLLALEPSVAFSEGLADAFAAIALGDPYYVDTRGPEQGSGHTYWTAAPPIQDQRGVYTEQSVKYMMWHLAGERASHGGDGYERIHATLRSAAAIQTRANLHTFAAQYNALYGADAENLRYYFHTMLDSPFDALCVGACTGSGDMPDPFDVDNDLGLHYAATRAYPLGTTTRMGAEFWQLYRPLALGMNGATTHDRIVYGDEVARFAGNRFGVWRWYRYVGTGRQTEISIQYLQGASCSEDVLDLGVVDRDRWAARDVGPGGCPSVRMPTEAGRSYLVAVNGLNRDLSSWAVQVTETGP